ncbi:DUF4998 domain-containing protein [Algibacter miyuki]|uniref:DUF4998 domain-containing protein n=1 Tax=Algibacter miyuki TaxID=1306933 RepID=A0ABV5GZI4_9FLAO|nr:DUF4998 domain-containing protein [Algibacter miyuki]MDN3666744.1 DUF4998 domain-containing protein [Algibacter miyuki]
MIIKYKRIIGRISLLALIITCSFSCETDLYETYSEYSDGNVVSVGSPDSLSVDSGLDKLMFKVFINADPKLKKGVISWNLGANEKTFNIDRTIYQNEIIDVEVEPGEGSYEFAVHLEDANGNKSNTLTLFTEVLGETYRADLVNRSLSGSTLSSETEVTLTWESNRYIDSKMVEQVTNDLLVKTELTYISEADGLEKTVVIDESEDTLVISDFIPEGSFNYKTFYKPTVDSVYIFESNPTEGTFPAKI